MHFSLEDTGSQEQPLHISSLMEEEAECITFQATWAEQHGLEEAGRGECQ